MNPSPDTVLAFWRDAGPAKWFRKDDAFDAEVKTRFLDLHEMAAAGQLTAWEATAESALALLIVLDQFPRNMFRGNARAFATDAAARDVADRAITQGFDRQVADGERLFFYLPFEHSENLDDQERGVALLRAITPVDPSPRTNGRGGASFWIRGTSQGAAKTNPLLGSNAMGTAFEPRDGRISTSWPARKSL